MVMHTEHHDSSVQSIGNQRGSSAAGWDGLGGRMLRSDQQHGCSRGIGKPNRARQVDSTWLWWWAVKLLAWCRWFRIQEIVQPSKMSNM